MGFFEHKKKKDMEESLTKRIALYASVGAEEVAKKQRKIERLEDTIFEMLDELEHVYAGDFVNEWETPIEDIEAALDYQAREVRLCGRANNIKLFGKCNNCHHSFLSYEEDRDLYHVCTIGPCPIGLCKSCTSKFDICKTCEVFRCRYHKRECCN